MRNSTIEKRNTKFPFTNAEWTIRGNSPLMKPGSYRRTGFRRTQSPMICATLYILQALTGRNHLAEHNNAQMNSQNLPYSDWESIPTNERCVFAVFKCAMEEPSFRRRQGNPNLMVIGTIRTNSKSSLGYTTPALSTHVSTLQTPNIGMRMMEYGDWGQWFAFIHIY